MHGTEPLTRTARRSRFTVVTPPASEGLDELGDRWPLDAEGSEAPWVGVVVVAGIAAGVVCLTAIARLGVVGRFLDGRWMAGIERLLGLYVLASFTVCAVLALAVEIGRPLRTGSSSQLRPAPRRRGT
ncbi:MAG: hypothetical protein JWO37_2911 [Acidimicrobiales bacterium]|jgi:hypothetical protein|nr:hypothetical protein [Acidimicrobiales bacterium]